MAHNNSQPVRTTLKDAARHLASRGWQPATIIDVGAADGTWELYDTFPKSSLILIEPLVEHEADLRKICESRDAQYLMAALGPELGTAVLNVHYDLHSSSMLRERDGEHLDGTPRQVPMTTLRHLCEQMRPQPPILAKLDVQGFEYEVLRASGDLLEEESNVVILESSLFEFYRGTPSLSDLIARMREDSFVLYDVVGQLYRPLDLALAQLDLVFVHERSSLWSNHSFATAKQRADVARASEPCHKRRIT